MAKAKVKAENEDSKNEVAIPEFVRLRDFLAWLQEQQEKPAAEVVEREIARLTGK